MNGFIQAFTIDTIESKICIERLLILDINAQRGIQDNWDSPVKYVVIKTFSFRVGPFFFLEIAMDNNLAVRRRNGFCPKTKGRNKESVTDNEKFEELLCQIGLVYSKHRPSLFFIGEKSLDSYQKNSFL